MGIPHTQHFKITDTNLLYPHGGVFLSSFHRNNGALQSKNWATRIRQRINSPSVEQRSRDSQVLPRYGGFKQHPPPINKTREATP